MAQRLKLEGLIRVRDTYQRVKLAFEPTLNNSKEKNGEENGPKVQQIKKEQSLNLEEEALADAREGALYPKTELHEGGNTPKPSSRRRKSTTSFFASAKELSNQEEIDNTLRQYILKGSDGTFSCGFCGKSGVKTKQNLIYHLETHIEGLSYPCQACDKTFRNRSTLSSHKATHRT